MRIGLGLGLTSALDKGGGAKQPWMWAAGALNVAGVVQNNQSFNSDPWMWLSGALGVGGFVQNARAF